VSNELREACIRSITNYMNDELNVGDNMAEFFRSQAEELLASVDRAIFKTKNHPMYEQIKAKAND
jgi:hypothetical protein